MIEKLLTVEKLIKEFEKKQEYIMKDGILFKWVDAYHKGGVYIACNQPYHYLELGSKGDVQMKCQENRCKHFIDGIWCEVFEDIPMGKNCYGAFEPIEKNGDCDD